ncbi:MAG: Nramp family divalent metal transporter, partial [Acidobacteria bacterium]|nr:Nramp family divalent metal transporter [Acidobacteriota bacterium]
MYTLTSKKRSNAPSNTGTTHHHRRHLPLVVNKTRTDGRLTSRLGWLRKLGPGLITGASDDDPSGIGTYSQVGSQFGFGMLWLALFTFPLMAAIQELCARIALETGEGLGILLRRKFPTWLVALSLVALFAANCFNLGADLVAVASGISLVTSGTIKTGQALVPIAIGIVAAQVFLGYRTIFMVFKWLTLALFAYVVTAVLARPAPLELLRATVVPHIELSSDFITGLVAVLGTTISPYLFFWQASAEVDEQRESGRLQRTRRHGVSTRELKTARVDVSVGMLFSQVIMYSIILTTGAVLHAHGKTQIQTAYEAAQALGPFLGRAAPTVFGLGMIGTGLLAIPILSGSAGYGIKEFFNLKGGLSEDPLRHPTFYAVVAIATAIGLLIALSGIDPIRALVLSAIVNGLVAPPLMILIILLGSDRAVMRSKTSGPLSTTLNWVGAGTMTAAAVVMLATF